MAASSSSSSSFSTIREEEEEEKDDYKRPYHIEHHYLNVYYDELYVIGCTSTRAYIITRCGRESYKAHYIQLSDAVNNKPLQNGVFTSQWKQYTHANVNDYQSACVFDSLLCIVEKDGFHLLHEHAELSSRVSMEFDHVDTCCINNIYLIVVYQNRRIFVYNHSESRIICNVRIDDIIVDVSFLFVYDDTFIATTSTNDTRFYKITNDSVQLSRRVCLLVAKDRINFTHEIRPCLFVTCSRSELSVVRADQSTGGIQMKVRSDFPSTIVDVIVMTGEKRNCIAVHDVEGCVQLLDWNLETFRTIGNHELFRPHNECKLPIHRIQRAYRSMTTFHDIFIILLPSADLCVIKFN